MAISSESRYNQGTITRMPDAEGNYGLTVLRTIPPGVAGFSLYVWQSGDRPDSVAAAQLGDSTLWWEIWDINPEIIYPLNIPPNSVIRIPSSPGSMSQGSLVQ